MDFSDESEYIFSLIRGFSNKVKNKELLIFYDLDEWIDIIDYYFIEEDNEELLEKAINLSLKQYPTNEELIVRKAEFIALENYENALLYLLESKKKLSNKKQILLLTYQGGQILSREGKHLNALKIAEDCLKHIENEYILNLAGYQYIKLNEFEKAKDSLLKAFEICYEKYTSKKTEEIKSYGANDFMFSATVIPDDLIFSTAELCKKVKKYKKIFYPFVEKFVEYDPQNSCYWEMLAEFYERCDEPEKALNACEYFLCLEPDDIDVIRKKYINYIDSGKKKDRVKILRKILETIENILKKEEINPKKRQDLLVCYAMTYKEIINIYIEEEKINKCIEVCKETLKKSLKIPFFSDKIFFSEQYIYHTLSRLYLQLGDTKLAEIYALTLIEKEPDNYVAKISYAEMLYMIGKSEKAIDIFQNLYETIEEEIAELKSNKRPNEDKLQILYTILTMLISMWAKLLFKSDIINTALDFLKLLIKELLTVDFVENNIFSAISTYAELVLTNNYPTEELKNMIISAAEIYGSSIIISLSSVSEIENSEDVYSFLGDLLKQFDYDEENY